MNTKASKKIKKYNQTKSETVSTISPLLIKEEIKNAMATNIQVKKIPKKINSKNKNRNFGSLEKRNKPGIPSPNNRPKERDIVIPKYFPKKRELLLTDFDSKTSENGIDSKKDIPENVMENSGITMRVKFIVLTSKRIPF